MLHAPPPSTDAASLSIRAARHGACFSCWQMCRHAVPHWAALRLMAPALCWPGSRPSHCRLAWGCPSRATGERAELMACSARQQAMLRVCGGESPSSLGTCPSCTIAMVSACSAQVGTRVGQPQLPQNLSEALPCEEMKVRELYVPVHGCLSAVGGCADGGWMLHRCRRQWRTAAFIKLHGTHLQLAAATQPKSQQQRVRLQCLSCCIVLVQGRCGPP